MSYSGTGTSGVGGGGGTWKRNKIGASYLKIILRFIEVLYKSLLVSVIHPQTGNWIFHFQTVWLESYKIHKNNITGQNQYFKIKIHRQVSNYTEY